MILATTQSIQPPTRVLVPSFIKTDLLILVCWRNQIEIEFYLKILLKTNVNGHSKQISTGDKWKKVVLYLFAHFSSSFFFTCRCVDLVRLLIESRQTSTFSLSFSSLLFIFFRTHRQGEDLLLTLLFYIILPSVSTIEKDEKKKRRAKMRKKDWERQSDKGVWKTASHRYKNAKKKCQRIVVDS